MIEVIPYHPAHVALLKANTPEGSIGDDAVAVAADMAVPGLVFTGMKDGFVVGIAGIKPLTPGRGHAWALLSDEVKQHPHFLHRVVKRMLPKLIQAGNFHRVELMVLDGFKPGCAWAARLGFEFEGIMRKFDPNKNDFHLYAMTK